MSLARCAPIVAFFLVTSIAHAQWEHLNVGPLVGDPPSPVPNSQSITTFNGALYVVTYPTGVRKSTDDGATWTIVNTGLPVTNGNVNARAIGHSATALLCGTESGVFRSLNAGASWESANGPTGASLPASALIYANKFYTFGTTTYAVFTGQVQNALGNGGIFRTINNGTSWLAGYSGLSANMTVYNMAMDGANIYASTSTSLMKSTDFGQSWAQAGTANFAVYAVQSVNDRIVAITSLGPRWSANGGVSWTNGSGYPPGQPVAGTDLIAFDGKFYAITKQGSSGCYRSLNGGATWSSYNDGIVSQADLFSQEEFHASGNKLYIACLFDSYSTMASTIGLEELEATDLPLPYPTTFSTHFTVDLSAKEAGGTLLLLDASGREVLRHGNVPASSMRIERGTLGAGMYQCVLLDPSTGAMRSFGPVIAE